jgi:DNA mismatch repair protein MutL
MNMRHTLHRRLAIVLQNVVIRGPGRFHHRPADARQDLAHRRGCTIRKPIKRLGRLLGNHQRVPLAQRPDIEDRNAMLVLIHPVGRDLATNNLAEYGITHARMICKRLTLDRPPYNRPMTAEPSIDHTHSIRPLPALLVNQIAAGEVIERPASVVKELVENCLDAGATRIEVDLDEGGIELIRVRDDGRGISQEQLPLALASHATSKIREADDLDRIVTMGFRGEALASIASIARVRIVSKPRQQNEAWEITADGGQITEPRPASNSPGTTIEVRNLFFNTPARRKFLRTPTTERGRCLDWLTDLALAHPAVAFIVRCDGKLRFEAPPGQTPFDRVVTLLGKELRSELIEVSIDQFDDSRGLALWGLVGRPSIAKATPRAQHVFLNGRTIRDRTIQHALRESYRGLIEPGRHPTAVLMIEMAPGAVDVNVHPAKLEVRFRDQSVVHQAVLHAVREALRSEDLTPAVPKWGGRSPLPGAASGTGFAPEGGGNVSVHPDALVEFLKQGPTPAPEAIRDALVEGASREPNPLEPSTDLPAPRRVDRVLQIHNSYIVTQDETGIVIIDQHALHERVMFERLIERVNAGPLESQRLLTPVVVPVTARQVEALDSLAPLLTRCGLELSQLTPTTIGINAFPTLLFQRGVDPVPFMIGLLERAETEDFVPTSEEALHEILDMMACKAAIKAGDAMAETELEELLRLRTAVERSSSCPHGRPTTVRLTIEQLEKLFHRR